MVDIGFIYDDSNRVALKKSQPSTSLRVTHFEGFLESAEQVDRWIVGHDFDIGIQWVNTLATASSEGATGTSTPALTPTVTFAHWF